MQSPTPIAFNRIPTIRLSHFCMTCIRPYTTPIRWALKANIQATTRTGKAVATANNTGNS